MTQDAVDQQIAIARLETEVAHLVATMAEFKVAAKEQRDEVHQANKALKEQIAAMAQQMQAMQNVMAQATGSWKTMLALVGLAGSVGAAMTYIATHWKP